MQQSLFSVISTIIIIINSIFIITAIFFERKKPIRALGWILTLSLLPGLGFVLYLMFGRTLHTKQKKFNIKCDLDKQYCRKIYQFLDSVYYDESMFKESYNEDIKQLIKFNINASDSPFTNDNNVTIFTDAQEKYFNLLNDIESAQSSIHMDYFILKNDEIGKKVIDALAKKAKQGVIVRVLFDHGSNIFSQYKAFRPIMDNGGEVLSFFSNSLGHYLKANFRNHRKIVIIDGRIGYVGGINIGDEYMGLHKRITPWRDTHMRVTGSCVYSLQIRFMEDWIYASRDEVDFGDIVKYFMPIKPNKSGNTGIQMVSSGPDTNGEEIKRGFIKMISSAKKRILIQTPYFVPDDPLLEALQNAAMSGVDVKIQIPAIPDKRVVYKVTTSFIEDVIDYGIKMYLYPGFLHAKMIAVDDAYCSLGTTNFDIRSFTLNFEINAFMYGQEITNKCAEIFNNDLKKCKLVTEKEYRNRGILTKIEEDIFRLMSPLL